MTDEETFRYVWGSYNTVHYRPLTRRRIAYWVGYTLEDVAQEAKLPSDPSPYRREAIWEEDDRVLFTDENRES